MEGMNERRKEGRKDTANYGQSDIHGHISESSG